MAISSLSAQYISASFQNLIQISSSGQVFDGLGNVITNLTASFATTASHALNAGTGIDTGSFATTGSNTFNGSQTINGNLTVTGSITTTDEITIKGTNVSASLANLQIASSSLNIQISNLTSATASYATTGSNTFNGSQTINGDLTVTGSIIAYQYIVSSSVINETIVFSSGSTIFGNSLDDIHIFTGSLLVTGSITTTDEITIKGTNVSASLANLQIASSSLNIQISNLTSATASYATTGSNTFIGNQIITGSLFMSQSNISTVDYIDYTLLSAEPSHLEGRVHWFDDTKTLQIDTDVNNFSIEVGHQNTIRVRNTTGGNLNAGKIVYINGESGNRPTVATASWDSDPTSATTLGFVAQQINDNQTGYVISSGIFRNIDTTAFSPGTQLYLSSSGDFTSTVPVTPKHEVRLGKTVTQAVSGVIYVDIMNGYEIGELHDVLAVSSSNGDLLVYSDSIWINTKQLTGSYSVTGSLLVSGSSTFKVIGPSEFTGSVAINGTLSAPAASITAQSITSNTVTATNYVSGSQILLNGHTISASIGDSLDTNGTYASTLTITSDNLIYPPLVRQFHIDPLTDTVIESPNIWINSSDAYGTETGLFLNTTYIGIPTHDKTPYTNQQVTRQNGVYIGTMNAHPSDKSVYPGNHNGLYGPAPALTILPFSGSFIGGQWVTRRANQIGINKYDSKFPLTDLYAPEMGNLSATLDVNGSTVISGSLTVTASITAQSITSNTVTATNYVSGSQLAIPGMIISSSIGDAFDTSLNSGAAFTTTIRPDNNTIYAQPLAISSYYDVIYQSPNLYINPGDNLNGIYSGMVFNASFIGIPTHFKTPYTNATVGRQNAVYIGTTAAHPVDRSNNISGNGLFAPAPAITILPWSGSYNGNYITQRPNQIGINKYDSEYLNNYNNGYEPQQMGNLSATLDVNGSVMVSGSLTVTASINATSVTASLFGTASYAVNSLTASYALTGGSGGISSTVSTAQTGSVTGTTSETLIQSLTIPANTLSTNDFARFSTKIFATNSNNYTVALYINSANTLNGSEKNITTLPVNSSIKFVIPTRTIAVNNVTVDTNWISENTQVQDPDQGSSATAHASSSINWTATQYALVSVTPQNAGDSFICRGTYFEKI